MSNYKAALYVVATPLGNLDDMTPRAIQVLRTVQFIAAEDTRHSGRLLQHFAINTPLFALHEHNEDEGAARVLELLTRGKSVALISDAGTPLISDPGFRVVRAVRAAGVTVIPVPGPSAAIAALSAAGLPTDRFVFEGFLPPRSVARQARLAQLNAETRTLVFYESAHRIVESVQDMVAMLGADRRGVIARELTKLYEEIYDAPLGELVAWLTSDDRHQKGEFVVLVAGREGREEGAMLAAENVLRVLLAELPLKQAAKLAAEITGINKNELYQKALALKQTT